MARRTFSKCGHKGLGAFCHRCKEADSVEAKANGLRPGEKRNALLSEATRLRNPKGWRPEPSTTFTPTSVEGEP